MKAYYAFLILLCPCHSRAQPLKPLLVGDKLPAITFTQTLNSKLKTINTTDLKGKLLLLDFWATWCGSCIKKFSMLDSMQRIHNRSLQVLLINTTGTGDNKEKLEKFLSRYKTTSGSRLSLPAVYGDTIAAACFPHQYIPHYAWIGKDGTCIAITGPDEVTPGNILAVLNDNIPAFAGLKLMDTFDFQKPLFLNGNGGNGGGITFRSTLSKYISGMLSAAGFKSTAQGLLTGYTVINTGLLDLVKQAYKTFPRTDRIQFNVADSLKDLLLANGDDPGKTGIYTYELLTPPLSRQEFFRFMRQDIERYFNITAVNQVNTLPCYALTVDSAILAKYRTKGGSQVNHLFKKEGRHITNRPLSTLTAYLNEFLDKPVVQKGSVGFNLDIALPDLPQENSAELTTVLAKMGIYLTPSNETIQQFTINELSKQ